MQHSYNTRYSVNQTPIFGGNFVEYDTHTIVRGSGNTLMAFQPANPHGTTIAYRVDQITMVLTLTQKLLDAYAKAVASGGVDRLHLRDVDGGDLEHDNEIESGL